MSFELNRKLAARRPALRTSANVDPVTANIIRGALETVCFEAATHLGLKAGTPVIQGGADGFIAIIGLGVTEPGELGLITGSSHLQLAVTDWIFHRPGLWGAYADCVYKGSAVLEGGQTSTGSVIKWFTNNFAAGTDYNELDRAAADIPPGADGLLVLDHFQGNRTPYIDPNPGAPWLD